MLDARNVAGTGGRATTRMWGESKFDFPIDPLARGGGSRVDSENRGSGSCGSGCLGCSLGERVFGGCGNCRFSGTHGLGCKFHRKDDEQGYWRLAFWAVIEAFRRDAAGAPGSFVNGLDPPQPGGRGEKMGCCAYHPGGEQCVGKRVTRADDSWDSRGCVNGAGTPGCSTTDASLGPRGKPSSNASPHCCTCVSEKRGVHSPDIPGKIPSHLGNDGETVMNGNENGPVCAEGKVKDQVCTIEGMQRTVQFSLQRTVQFSVQFSLAYSVQFNLAYSVQFS